MPHAPTSLEATLEVLRGSRPAMEALLRELVEISSYTDDKAGVDRVQAALRDQLTGRLEPLGVRLTVETQPSQRHGDQLAVSTPAATAPGARPLVLVGHADTVFPLATFSGYRSDGELAYGPGVLDMKGGLVVIVFALEALGRAGLLERLPLHLVVVSDEEVGSPESQPFLAERCRGAAGALVFESGRARDAIITRRKGTAGVVVTAHGKAAHAGNLHHEGRNAIWALARFIDRAQALTDYDRGITVNVGKVEGGLGKNTVPDRALAHADFRYVEPADGEAVLSRMRALCDEIAAELPGTRLELSGGIGRRPLERDAAVEALYREYAEHARASGLGDGEAPLIGGGSDASTAQAAGCPAIDGLGPRGTGFHTVEERVELGSFVPKAEALVRFLAARAIVAGPSGPPHGPRSAR